MEALVEAEGDTALKKDIQNKIKAYMNEKYSDENVKNTIDMAATLDPRFMMNYCSEEEQAIVQPRILAEGKLVARRIDESHPPLEYGETTKGTLQETPPPNKKRKLVDILSKVSTARHQCANNEERIQVELTS